MESYLTDEEAERLENHAQSSSPQLWSADGGEPISISEIVKQRGMATNKDGGKYHPKKWTPVGLDSMVNKWSPTGNADDFESCACDANDSEVCEGPEKCDCKLEGCERCN